MSVRPVVFNADGSIDVVFDEFDHRGTVPAADVMWGVRFDGSPSHTTILLNCPDGCGATSVHPVGGGAAPAEVQRLFVRKTEADGCACGEVAAATTGLPEAHVRLNCSRMDGPRRWVDTTDSPPDEEGLERPPIVYRVSDRLVIGEHPRPGEYPEHSFATLRFTEYAKLLRTDPAYVTPAGDIVDTSPVAPAPLNGGTPPPTS